MTKEDRDNIVYILTSGYTIVSEDDCLGDMMKFMDTWGYPYAHLLVGDDISEQNQVIRTCFKLAWAEKVEVNLKVILDAARYRIFGGAE